MGYMRRASRLLIISYYTAPYLTAPLPSLSFVRSCFHLSSLLFSRSTRYFHTIPSIPRSCNNVLSTLTTSFSTHHTYFTHSLAGPKLKIRRHIFFTFGSQQLKLKIHGLLLRGPLLGCSILHQLLFISLGNGVHSHSYQSSRRHLRVHTL